MPAIPQITALLSDGELNVFKTSADALAKLSEKCGLFKFMTLMLLMYL
jgi:HEAT repeat protein